MQTEVEVEFAQRTLIEQLTIRESSILQRHAYSQLYDLYKQSITNLS
jgi:hypothetical protein